MRVMMAQGAIVRRNLDRKAADEFIRDDEMMPRFVLDGNGVFAIVRSLHSSHIAQPIQSRLKPVARVRRWPAAITASTGQLHYCIIPPDLPGGGTLMRGCLP